MYKEENEQNATLLVPVCSILGVEGLGHQNCSGWSKIGCFGWSIIDQYVQAKQATCSSRSKERMREVLVVSDKQTISFSSVVR